MKRFRRGDRVSHITVGDGVVIGDGNLIVVQYQHLVGKYDANWFKVNPHFLFHRGTEPLPQSE